MQGREDTDGWTAEKEAAERTASAGEQTLAALGEKEAGTAALLWGLKRQQHRLYSPSEQGQ